MTRSDSKVNIRRIKALQRLEVQLKMGKKSLKNETVDLTEGDKKRINKELDILRERIVKA